MAQPSVTLIVTVFPDTLTTCAFQAEAESISALKVIDMVSDSAPSFPEVVTLTVAPLPQAPDTLAVAPAITLAIFPGTKIDTTIIIVAIKTAKRSHLKYLIKSLPPITFLANQVMSIIIQGL